MTTAWVQCVRYSQHCPFITMLFYTRFSNWVWFSSTVLEFQSLHILQTVTKVGHLKRRLLYVITDALSLLCFNCRKAGQAKCAFSTLQSTSRQVAGAVLLSKRPFTAHHRAYNKLHFYIVGCVLLNGLWTNKQKCPTRFSGPYVYMHVVHWSTL